MKNLSIGTLNVRGLCSHPVRHKVFTWLNELKIDIAFLQETYCQNKFETTFNSLWNGKIYHAFTDSSHSRGVCIMFNDKLNVELINKHASEDGRILLLNVKLFEQIYCFVNVYAPNTELNRKSIFEKVHKWILQYSLNMDNLVVCGDLNTCLSDKDRLPATHLKDSSRIKLQSIINSLKLTDLWALKNPNVLGFTFLDKQHNTKSRLDYILCSKGLVYDKCKCLIVPSFNKKQVDHDLVKSVLHVNSRPKGPNYWKLNCEHLENEEYCNFMKCVIKETLNEYNGVISHQLIWEILKINVKESSIHFASKLSRQNKSKVCELQSQLNKLKENIDNNCDDNNELVNEQNNIQNELNLLLESKTKGAFIRARAQWCEEGEHCSKYFVNLEKQRQCHNTINMLKTDDGNYVSNDKDILECAALFYDKLYTCNNIPIHEINDYINSVNNVNVLSEQQKALCDNDITNEELNNVISILKVNKSPGLDGLTSEFYKVFWDILKQPFVNMLNETFQKGILPDTMRRAVVTLIYKKGDLESLKNYRPISLSNYDYKILAFTLAIRMQKVIGNLISTNQTAYIKNRYIGNNARFIQDILDYTEKGEIPGALISLDFEKAFDKLDWNFMLKCLQKYNFGPVFIKWIQIMYEKPSLVVKNNGFFSREIPMSAGIRQGCPVSALLFILASEMLAIKIRTNKSIKGILCNDREYKISQYADDSNLTVADILSIDNALDEIERFSYVAGPRLNIYKTEGVWLGPLQNDWMDVYKGIHFKNTPIKCIGIFIGYNRDQCEKLNWDSKIISFENMLKIWNQRKLTIFGKVTVINMLAISKFIYNFTTINVPEWVIIKLEKAITDFLWKKRSRINRNCLISKIEEGGINLVDVRSKIESLKCSWISKWSDNINLPWYNLATAIFKQHNLNFEILINCNIRNPKNCSLSKIPVFYQDVFYSYYKCKNNLEVTTMNSYEFMTTQIWGNELLMNNNKCLFFNNWIDCNFIYIKDLFDKEGHFVSEQFVFAKLKRRHNWIAEYAIIKRLVLRLVKKQNFDTNLAQYVNINSSIPFLIVYNQRKYDIRKEKTKLFYQILIHKKRTRHFMEKRWCQLFNKKLSFEQWKCVYIRKIQQVHFKKFAEFNFKLLNGILISGYILNKWNKSVPNICTRCNSNDTNIHMLFLCPRIRTIWTMVSQTLKIDLCWENIVFGLNENNLINIARNNVITIVAYAIYASFIKYCENDYYTININNMVNNYPGTIISNIIKYCMII